MDRNKLETRVTLVVIWTVIACAVVGVILTVMLLTGKIDYVRPGLTEDPTLKVLDAGVLIRTEDRTTGVVCYIGADREGFMCYSPVELGMGCFDDSGQGSAPCEEAEGDREP